MNTLAPSFFIGSSSYLQVTKIFITSRSRSKVGQIRPRTVELAALEKSHILIMEVVLHSTDSAYFVKSTPPRAFSVSFLFFADMLQTY